MHTPMIECHGIKKTFVQRTIPVVRLQDLLLGLQKRSEIMRIEAVKPCTFTVKKGEWVAICGPNGSGKTTLMKMIAGLLPPDGGSIQLHGTVSTFFDLGTGFHPERAALENIRLYGLLQGLSTKEIQAMTTGIVQFANIDRFMDLPLKCYSTGMHLRLAFATAAHIDTDIYLFDEILAVGDPDFQRTCFRYIQTLKNAGKTAIIVGNSLEGLAPFVDRMMTLEGGSMRNDALLKGAV
jgi:ABC-type polysaccharide/polyol phosphate transport system ATPase subunit